MLSGETSVGHYPVECVEILNRAALRIERSGGAGYAENAILEDARQKTVAAAVVLGELGVRSPAAVSALSQMARDPLAALAEPAIEALGKLGARNALPALLDALERKELRKPASEAIASLGEEVLPALRDRAARAAPEVRAALSELLPAMRGSFAMVLEGLSGQPFEVVNRVALSVRHSARTSAPGLRRRCRRSRRA